MLSRFYRTALVCSLSLVLCSGFACAVPAGATVVPASGDVTLEPALPKQGQPLLVRVTVPKGSEVPALVFNKKTYKLFPEAGGAVRGGMASVAGSDSDGAADDQCVYRAVIGVPANLNPGTYSLRVGETVRQVKVGSGVFGVQHIRLPKGKDNFISSPGEEEAVKAAKATVSPEKMWTGKFKLPSPARTSSQFGLRRMVNGRLLTDYFHSGLDFAGALGSPVVAAQRGRVIIAKNGWRLHGNTIALDHGQGVISFYIHLSKILVQPGQIVEAGETIGKIGSTGRASGPHLHFSIYANGDATSPRDWFSRSL